MENVVSGRIRHRDPHGSGVGNVESVADPAWIRFGTWGAGCPLLVNNGAPGRIRGEIYFQGARPTRQDIAEHTIFDRIHPRIRLQMFPTPYKTRGLAAPLSTADV